MNARRWKFLAAVVVFALWVAALGVMAARSNRPSAAFPGGPARR